MTFLRLTVPLMLGRIVSGLVLTWVTLVSELSSTVVLYSGPWRTLTVIMFQALEGTGAGVAVAAASLLIGITRIPVLIAYRFCGVTNCPRFEHRARYRSKIAAQISHPDGSGDRSRRHLKGGSRCRQQTARCLVRSRKRHAGHCVGLWIGRTCKGWDLQNGCPPTSREQSNTAGNAIKNVANS